MFNIILTLWFFSGFMTALYIIKKSGGIKEYLKIFDYLNNSDYNIVIKRPVNEKLFIFSVFLIIYISCGTISVLVLFIQDIIYPIVIKIFKSIIDENTTKEKTIIKNKFD